MKKTGLVVIGVVIGWLGTHFYTGFTSAGFPIKYEICDSQGNDCHVHAHFKDFDGCEFHMKFMTANCDSTKPGKISCVTGLPSSATSHCTR